MNHQSTPSPRRARALDKQAERWRRLAGLVDKLLLNES
jgi:hypothetical protein